MVDNRLLRVCAIATVPLLAAIAPAAQADPAAARAASDTCQVVNVTSDIGPSTNLQRMINGANVRDRLRVSGTCVGNFHVDQDLVLVGRRTERRARGVLNGGGDGRVLTVRGGATTDIRLVDLTITHGRARGDSGGGLAIQGHVVLKGSTLITRNRGLLGGGVKMEGLTSRLRMKDRSSISDNESGPIGCGGVTLVHGRVEMSDHSSVSGNSGITGGICIRNGTLRLTNSAAVSGNVGVLTGGVYLEGGALIKMSNHSSVSANKSRVGAGLAMIGDQRKSHPDPILSMGGSATIAGNRASDSGGGVWNRYGIITITHGAVIRDNEATHRHGGGIFQVGGSVTMSGTATVTRNTSGNAGGGIYNDATLPGLITINGSASVTRNDPDDCVGC